MLRSRRRNALFGVDQKDTLGVSRLRFWEHSHPVDWVSDLKEEGAGTFNRRRIAVESASEPPGRWPKALQESTLLELGAPIALVD